MIIFDYLINMGIACIILCISGDLFAIIYSGMKQYLLVFMSLVIFLALVGTGWAAHTYYIDADNGNDSANGLTPELGGLPSVGPWKTYPVISPRPGDTVLYKRGTTGWYRFFIVSWQGTGTDANRVTTFATYGSGSFPVISSHYNVKPTTGWGTPDVNGIYTKNVGAVTVSTTDFVEDYYTLLKATSSKLSDGYWYYSNPNLYYKPTSGAVTDHIIRIFKPNGYTMYPSEGTVNSYTTYKNLKFVGKTLFLNNNPSGFSHVTFQNCEFLGIFGYYGAIQISPGESLASYITFDRCTWQYCNDNVYFEVGKRTDSYFDHIWIKNCKFLHTGDVRGGQYTWQTMGGDSDGISFQNLQNSTIENNEISGSCYSYGGIHLWSAAAFGLVNNNIRCNYIHDITRGAGIIYGGADITGTSYGTICNNIIVRCAGTTFPYYGGIFANRINDSINKLKIYNNTVYNCAYGINLFDQADYVDVKNNMVFGSTKKQAVMTSTDRNNTFDYNCYYPTLGSPFSYNGIAQSWATWSARRDKHGVPYDPRFVNAGGSYTLATDFKLKLNSPAIDAGTSVSLTTDYEGRPVPIGSAPDIGAFEH